MEILLLILVIIGFVFSMVCLFYFFKKIVIDDYIIKRNLKIEQRKIKSFLDKISELKMIPLITEQGDFFSSTEELLKSNYIKDKKIDFYYHLYKIIENKPRTVEDLNFLIFIYNTNN